MSARLKELKEEYRQANKEFNNTTGYDKKKKMWGLKDQIDATKAELKELEAQQKTVANAQKTYDKANEKITKSVFNRFGNLPADHYPIERRNIYLK